MFKRFLFPILLLLPHLIFANPYYSIANGDWSDPSSWSLTLDGLATSKFPAPSDTVYLRHAITHNTGGTYTHTGNVIIEAGGYLHLNTGYGSSKVYKFEGDRFEVFGTLTTTSDFFHQASWSDDYGILILHEGSGFAIGDDLILSGTSETILNTTNCGDAGSLDDIYFQGTKAKICGQGNFIIPDRMRAWNDSRSEIVPASSQIVNQICAGFQLFDDPGTCTSPAITGGGTFVLNQRDFDLRLSVEPKQIRLRWRIDENSRDARYFIERSHNGQDFSPLAKATFGQSGPELEGLDTQPLIGLQYYRIKQSQADKKSLYSEVVSINYHDPAPRLQVSLDPAQPTHMRLRGIMSDQSLSIRLYDINGALIQKSSLPPSRTGTTDLMLSPNLAPGIYVLEVIHPSSHMQARFVFP